MSSRYLFAVIYKNYFMVFVEIVFVSVHHWHNSMAHFAANHSYLSGVAVSLKTFSSCEIVPSIFY